MIVRLICMTKDFLSTQWSLSQSLCLYSCSSWKPLCCRCTIYVSIFPPSLLPCCPSLQPKWPNVTLLFLLKTSSFFSYYLQFSDIFMELLCFSPFHQFVVRNKYFSILSSECRSESFHDQPCDYTWCFAVMYSMSHMCANLW